MLELQLEILQEGNMKKVLLIALVLCLLISCASLPNTQGSEYMATVEDTETSNGKWKQKYFVDEFDSYTDEAYISTSISGTFTNSATNGSRLGGTFLITKDCVEIKLLEYGSHPVTLIGEKRSITVRMKAGGVTTDLGYVSFGSHRVIIHNTQPIFQALAENDTVSFYIAISNYGTSTYNFSISGNGFVHTYKTTFPITIEQ